MENPKLAQLSATLNPSNPCSTVEEVLSPTRLTNTPPHPKKSWWTCFNLIHLLIPVSRIVYAFPQDFPMNFATPLREKLGMTDQQLQHLYSAYFLPNIVAGLVFGVILKKYGLRSTYVLFGLSLLGEGIFMLGIGENVFWLQ